MNIYNVAGIELALINGVLYQRLEPNSEDGERAVTGEAPDAPPTAGRGRPRGSKTGGDGGLTAITRRVKERQERKARKHLDPEAEDAIMADIGLGLGLSAACEKHDISVSTYYRLKNQSESKPVIEE